jgi:AraC family transcriptional regulator, transcriptional activator of pobA
MFNTYTIADFLKNTDLPREHRDGVHFHINRLENMPVLPPHIVTPHKHHFYELFLVTAGVATHTVDYQDYTLSKNTFFLISQGQLHFFEKGNRAHLKGYRLMFTEAFFQMNQLDNQFLFELIHLDNVYQKPFIALSPESDAFIFTYFDLLFQEYQRANTYERAL